MFDLPPHLLSLKLVCPYYLCYSCSHRLNVWDVGGQKTLRSYWRNYYEQTDGMVRVYFSTEGFEPGDCCLLQAT